MKDGIETTGWKNDANLEQSMIENRQNRQLQHGQGQALLDQHDANVEMTNKEEGTAYYRRKGVNVRDGFNVSQMYGDGFEPLLNKEENTYGISNQYIAEGERTIFGYDMATGKKVDNMDHEATFMGALPRIVLGGAYDMARGAAEFGEEVKNEFNVPGWADPIAGARRAFLDSEEPDFLNQSAGTGEDIARGLSQFGWGYAGAYKVLGGLGLKSFIAKDVGASIVGGQTFDPADGTLGTFLAEMDMLPDTMRMLDSKLTTEEEGRWMGRLSMALEEVAIGAGISAVKVANNVRKSIKGRYNAMGHQVMQKGIEEYRMTTNSVNHPTLGWRNDLAVNEEETQKAVDKIATGYIMTGGKQPEFLTMARNGGIDEKMAKKAWNNSLRNKLERTATFLDTGPKTPQQRQRGSISYDDTRAPLETDLMIRPGTNYDVDDLTRHYRKQMKRGNVTKAEYEDVIAPLLKGLKNSGTQNLTGDKLIQYAELARPEFRRVILDGNDAKFIKHTWSPRRGVDNTDDDGFGLSVLDGPDNVPEGQAYVFEEGSYTEHVFTSRNKLEEEIGNPTFMNSAHYQQPYVKGHARTTIMNNINETPGSDVTYIHELQSDHASTARKLGTWTDGELQSLKIKVKGAVKEVNLGQYRYDPDKFKEMYARLSTKEKNLVDSENIDILNDAVDEVRPFLASPSAFNDDKNWIRQVIRPVVNGSVEKGIRRIVLATKNQSSSRSAHSASADAYLDSYPKILKKYFQDIGVPDADIHMPTDANESFWVDLPEQMMIDGAAGKLPPLPAYSAAPIGAGLMGEQNDDQ